MNPFAFLRRKRSVEQLLRQGRHAALKELIPVYPAGHMALPTRGQGYPEATSLEVDGLGAYLLDVHLDREHLADVEQLIWQLGFHQQQQTGSFNTFDREAQSSESVSLQRETLGNGTSLLLISNSLALLEALPELAPPAPWRVFPDIDADGLGSLQGSLEYWWNQYWWPYWQSLSQEQRKQWLQEPTHPEGWREYLHLQDALNGNDMESPA